MLPVLALTLAIFVISMLIMSVGVIFKRPCLRGSCGGPDVLGPDGQPLTCATCPNRDEQADGESCEVSSATEKGPLRILSRAEPDAGSGH